jgi:trehalose-6-phosphatase
MTYLFSCANQNLIERFASSNVLLVFDYDGTLAPLVREPRTGCHASLDASTAQARE